MIKQHSVSALSTVLYQQYIGKFAIFAFCIRAVPCSDITHTKLVSWTNLNSSSPDQKKSEEEKIVFWQVSEINMFIMKSDEHHNQQRRNKTFYVGSVTFSFTLRLVLFVVNWAWCALNCFQVSDGTWKSIYSFRLILKMICWKLTISVWIWETRLFSNS